MPPSPNPHRGGDEVRVGQRSGQFRSVQPRAEPLEVAGVAYKPFPRGGFDNARAAGAFGELHDPMHRGADIHRRDWDDDLLAIIVIVLVRVGIVTVEQLREARPYVIVGSFVVAAVITPPDIISQIGLGIPIIILYELSIIAVRMVERRRLARAGSADAGLFRPLRQRPQPDYARGHPGGGPRGRPGPAGAERRPAKRQRLLFLRHRGQFHRQMD